PLRTWFHGPHPITLLVILHIPSEPPAPTTTSRARGDRVEIGEEGVLPDWRRLDRIVAIAGPTGAHPS
ncbi:MAG: hypothetical protein ACXVHL_30045, partial [Solirubrobacteraceae bacterium]